MGEDAGGERLLRGYAGRLFIGISLGWFLIVFGRQLLPPLLPSIIADLEISSFQAGIALTGLFAMRALNQYPGGRLADQLSRKTVLVGSLLIASVGFVLLSASVVYALFLLAVAVVGVGAGAYSVTTRATTADLYIEKRGRAFGVQGAFTSVAGVASAGGAVVALAVGDWRSAFLPIVAVLLLLVVSLHRWNRDPYVVERIEFEILGTARRVLGAVQIRRVVAAYVLCLFSWMGIIGFLPTFLQIEKGLSPTAASAGFGLVYVVGVIAGPFAGVFGDRYGKLRMSVLAMLFGMVGVFALVVVDAIALIALFIAMLAIGFWSFFPVTQAYLMDSFSDDTMAGDLGAVKTVWGLAGSLGPAYIGFVADFQDYTVAYLGTVGCLLVALGVIAYAKRSD